MPKYAKTNEALEIAMEIASKNAELIKRLGDQPDLNDPREHWVNNPLIKPRSKVAMYDKMIREAKAEAWLEGYIQAFNNPGKSWGHNPYRSEQ